MAANPSPEIKAILKLTPDLTTALSNEPLGVANELLSKGLISDEVYSEVLMPTSSATRKAAIMIESVSKVIELMPSKFTEFLEALSELNCARLVESLRSTCQSESALASQILQFSMSLVTTTPSSTMSLASSMIGPSPSPMMLQYQERSLAHHGMGMQHTRMGQLRMSHPMATAATGMQGIQPTPRSMIRVSQPSVEVAHSRMGVVQLPNVYTQQQAHYTTEIQASGDIGPSPIHAGRLEMASGVYPHVIPHVTPPHRMLTTTSTHSQMSKSELRVGEYRNSLCTCRVTYQSSDTIESQTCAILIRIMALVGHMQIDSMLPTTPFGLLVDIDSNRLPLASDSSKMIG